MLDDVRIFLLFDFVTCLSLFSQLFVIHNQLLKDSYIFEISIEFVTWYKFTNNFFVTFKAIPIKKKDLMPKMSKENFFSYIKVRKSPKKWSSYHLYLLRYGKKTRGRMKILHQVEQGYYYLLTNNLYTFIKIRWINLKTGGFQ